MTDKKTSQSLPLSEAICIAAQAIGEVMSGRSLTEVLEQLDAHERPIVQSLSFDALRKWVRSHELIKQFIPKTPPPEVDHLLSVAIALFLQEPTEGKGYPAHTIVDQAVKACGEYDPTMYAKGLVNAVLRKVSLTVLNFISNIEVIVELFAFKQKAAGQIEVFANTSFIQC